MIFLIFIGFIGLIVSASAVHDPNQIQTHSVILPQDMREETFEEFMEWCSPFYKERCTELYEENQIANSLSPLKQFKSGVAIDEIQCRNSLTLVVKYDGAPACVKEESIPKLIERGWSKLHMYHYDDVVVLSEGQSWGYIRDISILDNGYVGMTMSYPTNKAHHEIYPDEHQSIVGNCTEQDNSAILSLLYLKESNKEQNKITFTKKNKTFDGLKCDDALWQELIRWGYCGPPGLLLSNRDAEVSSIAEMHKQAGFVLDLPKYLPEGYDIQKITVGREGNKVVMYISPEPISHETNSCDFAWHYEGIYLNYSIHPEILNWGSYYSDSPDEPQTWPVTIMENPGRAEQRWVGDRFGTPIPQQSDLQLSIPDEGTLVTMSSSLPVEELIKVAESISNPIFNSDIVPDYSKTALHVENSSNDDDIHSVPVKITGKTSTQICNKIRMMCDDGHVFSAMYNMHTDTATFEQSVSYNNYVLDISNRELCYKINSDPTDYCSFLNVDYSPILDGNKPTMLSQPLDFWKDMTREEQFSFHEEYGGLFFEELGKIVLKDELKKEFEKQNITNTNNDFRLHTGMVEESLPPFVYYTTVINSTDGKSYMFGGRTHTNQVLDIYHNELIFYDNVSAKLPIDSFRNDSPAIVIRPENEHNSNTDKLFMNFDKNQEVVFVNSMSVPIRIQDKGSDDPERENEIAWMGPIMNPKDTWRMQINSTGYYEWNSKIVPAEHGGWWESNESGDIIVYSEDMEDVDFREKLRIAGEFVMDSEIAIGGIGMGNNEGLRIGFSSSITEMLPNAMDYYKKRVVQLIPFDIPIIIEK